VTLKKSAGSQTPELSLIGTVIGKRESIAVFVDDGTKNPLRLRAGEGRKDWMLRSVQGTGSDAGERRRKPQLEFAAAGN
jgi:hypothetical protein